MLTRGRYTGQPMDVAHKHLGITPDEWNAFMADAALTMDALHIDKGMQAELGEIFNSFRSQVIVEPGKKVPARPMGAHPPAPWEPTQTHHMMTWQVPADPKLCRKPPDGNSTYAQAGGVYPIAAFADTLVDLAMAKTKTKELTLSYEDVKKPGATRHPPGLKYLLTELLCHKAGGPEVIATWGLSS